MKRLLILLVAFLLLVPGIVSAETIIDIFPDANVARFIRDEIGAFDVTDEVSQEQLDKIWLFGNFSGYGEIHDISGVSRLRGVSFIRLSRYWESDVSITELPEEITLMDWVTDIEATSLHDLKSLPADIGNMKGLLRLDLSNSGITYLPDSICTLDHLESINLSGCPIERLPDNIGDLKSLKHLDISDTKITELPESIRSLSLESFRRKGTPL